MPTNLASVHLVPLMAQRKWGTQTHFRQPSTIGGHLQVLDERNTVESRSEYQMRLAVERRVSIECYVLFARQMRHNCTGQFWYNQWNESN